MPVLGVELGWVGERQGRTHEFVSEETLPVDFFASRGDELVVSAEYGLVVLGALSCVYECVQILLVERGETEKN
jgi:hypothetical protein